MSLSSLDRKSLIHVEHLLMAVASTLDVEKTTCHCCGVAKSRNVKEKWLATSLRSAANKIKRSLERFDDVAPVDDTQEEP